MGKKGQFATEYIITIAFAFLIVTTVVYVMYGQFGKQVKEVDMAQLKKFGNSLVDAVSRVNYLGEGSVITISPMMPGWVKNVSVEQGNTIVFTFEGDIGQEAVFFKAPVNVMVDMDNFNRGLKKMVIRDKKDYTLICSQDSEMRCNNRCDYSLGENYSNVPSDCCTSTCNGCDDAEDKSYVLCSHSPAQHTECCGFNGCTAVC